MVVSASHVGGIRIVTPSGSAVGDPINDLANDLPGDAIVDAGDATSGWTIALYDNVSPAAEPSGAQAASEAVRGPISTLRAPILFDSYGGC